ncbi:cyclase family protein [Paraglaciecola aquimarina]|uniref:Cyclase family protein n=1 Tax=Paraglaciecola aquimarina TaxID=1235557 RepID=A0ABU3SU46_9ALTE|nr:cyclase family protein [Paraglaciecola aquimarina]MDU0353525.1 cyclase family protein [Paraglaciecola aquimarina]
MTNSAPNTNELIDLSHRIFDGLVTYKGLPAPIMCDYLSREKSKEIYGNDYQVQIGKIEMVSNTGTYLDSPFHFDENGADLAALSLELLANLPAVLVDVKDQIKIDVDTFTGVDVAGKAVLVYTNWSQHWDSEQYFENHAYLTEQAAQWLVANGAKLVGIDSHNIDDTRGKLRPVHKHLLGNDVLIVEHMTNLARLPKNGFRFFAVPPKITGVGTFPVRAFAQVVVP